MSIAVLVPVLGRPQRVQPLIDSLAACSQVIKCIPYFLASPGDDAEHEAVRAAQARLAIMDWEAGQGDYAKKMNRGFEITDEQFVFLGADDLDFHPGWAERAVACWYETGACVVGTNDLGNRRVTSGQHSTHTLVHRAYGECGTVDESDKIIHEGYWHNFCDDEFIATAKWRATYAQAGDALVEHLHPNWGKGEQDDTYLRGQEHFNDDRTYHRERARLWAGRPYA